MNIIKRVKAPTPKFFRVLRNIGLALAAIGGTLVASPIALPVVVTTVGGYLAVAGGVVSAVSQLTTAEEETPNAIEPFGVQKGLQQAQPDNGPQPDSISDEQGIKGKKKTLTPKKQSGLKAGLREAQPDNGPNDVG